MKYNLAIIDADSIIYLVGSKFKDVRVKSLGIKSMDDFIEDILKTTMSRYYVGFFGKIKGAKNFRYSIAETRGYKGTRPEKPEWFEFWEPILKKHMEMAWGFMPTEYVEADDMCTMYATKYEDSKDYDKIIICSPDKDLRQKGNVWIYDYRTREFEYISEVDATKNLAYQMILGDSTDNIPGLPGKGKVAAEEFINSLTHTNPSTILQAVKDYYKKYLHEEYPAKLVKTAEKTYLNNYKLSHGIKRFTKKLKNEALQYFNVGGKMFIPENTDFYKDYYDEMYALVYMLRTEEEIKDKWPGIKFVKPQKEEVMNWEAIEERHNLIHGDDAEILESFDEDLGYLEDDEFDDDEF